MLTQQQWSGLTKADIDSWLTGIQLSKFNRAPQGVVSGVRGEYPTSKNVFLLIPLTNQLANFLVVWQKTF